MSSKYALKLGLKISLTNSRAQTINNSTFEKFKIFLASCQIKDIFRRAWFFKKFFLLADLNI